MIGLRTVSVGVICSSSMMMCVAGLGCETSPQLGTGFVEQLHHALPRGLVEDRGDRLEVLDTPLD